MSSEEQIVQATPPPRRFGNAAWIKSCYAAMEKALEEPVALSFQSKEKACAWRTHCYRVRDVLRVVHNDMRFEGMIFNISGTILTIRMKGD